MVSKTIGSWEISSTSLAVSEFTTATNADVSKPQISFSVNFTNTKPIDIVVTDLAFGSAGDAQLKALFDPLIINNTGVNWTGFRIDLVDVDSGHRR